MKPTSASVSSAQKEMYYIKCPYCGRSFGEFIETGLVGCERCYTELSDLLSPYIAACQPSNRHPVMLSDKEMERNRYIFKLVKEREAYRGRLESCVREGNLAAANEMLEKINEISAVLAREKED